MYQKEKSTSYTISFGLPKNQNQGCLTKKKHQWPAQNTKQSLKNRWHICINVVVRNIQTVVGDIQIHLGQCNLANQKSLQYYVLLSLALNVGTYVCILYSTYENCIQLVPSHHPINKKSVIQKMFNIETFIYLTTCELQNIVNISQQQYREIALVRKCRKGSQFPFFHTHLKPLWSSFLLMKFLSLESTIGSVNTQSSSSISTSQPPTKVFPSLLVFEYSQYYQSCCCCSL